MNNIKKIAWNKGMGGPKPCVDCGSKKKDHRSKRCKKCHLKVRSQNLGKYSQRNNIPWNKNKNSLPMCSVCGIRLNNYSSTKCKKCFFKTTDYSKIFFPQKGEKNPNWKGGISKQSRIERKKFRTEIQPLVFERDNFTCQLCGQYGGLLQVDHIKRWSEYFDLRFNIDNCRTLCDKCHYKVTFGKKMPADIKRWGQNFSHTGR